MFYNKTIVILGIMFLVMKCYMDNSSVVTSVLYKRFLPRNGTLFLKPKQRTTLFDIFSMPAHSLSECAVMTSIKSGTSFIFKKETQECRITTASYVSGIFPPGYDLFVPSNRDKSLKDCYYKFYELPLRNYSEASVFCHSEGGYIVSIDSKEENNFVADLILGLLVGEGTDRVWIGKLRALDNSSYVWENKQNNTYEESMHILPPITSYPCVCLYFLKPNGTFTEYPWHNYPCIVEVSVLCEFDFCV